MHGEELTFSSKIEKIFMIFFNEAKYFESLVNMIMFSIKYRVKV